MTTPHPRGRAAPLNSALFALLHLAPFAALFVEVTWADFALCAALYLVRMFAITAGFHRYFAHRAFKVGRLTQFLLALIGTTAAQKGVLWWAGHHRHHHRHSDQDADIHSPKRGFWWAHMGWFLCPDYEATPSKQIREFGRYPELVWLNKHWAIPPAVLGLAVLLIGGWGAFLVGFCLSTVLLYHGTFTINSLSHVFGKRRFATTDTSRNNWLLALITLGEGWHNNHHHYQSSANQGFYWYELDVSYYGIKLLEALGLAWELRKPTARALGRLRLDQGTVDVGMLELPGLSSTDVG